MRYLPVINWQPSVDQLACHRITLLFTVAYSFPQLAEKSPRHRIPKPSPDTFLSKVYLSQSLAFQITSWALVSPANKLQMGEMREQPYTAR